MQIEDDSNQDESDEDNEEDEEDTEDTEENEVIEVKRQKMYELKHDYDATPARNRALATQSAIESAWAQRGQSTFGRPTASFSTRVPPAFSTHGNGPDDETKEDKYDSGYDSVTERRRALARQAALELERARRNPRSFRRAVARFRR